MSTWVHRRRSRGVSLIEALVALAVMTFGMLGVVGMQAALRTGADQSKQRSEAVRLAQEEMERLRGFGQTQTAPVGEHTYALIANAPAASASLLSNTEFVRTVGVIDHPASSASAPRMKTVTVNVTWRDRQDDTTAATERSVTLRSIVAEIAPALGGSLGLPTNRSAPTRPGGRHPSIPRGATPGTGDTSNFSPPGTTGVTFVFNNQTGLIVSCVPAIICPAVSTALLTGYIRFATGNQPDANEAEAPNDNIPAALASMGVTLTFTLPAPGGTVDTAGGSCYINNAGSSRRLTYYCAVPLATLGFPSNYTWTGTLDLVMPPNTLANDTTPGVPTDADSTRFRVCRYTPDATTDMPPAGNDAHPLVYTGVATSLTDQNFLVVQAGDGASVFTCPTDSDGDLVNGTTKLHQPR
jgi:Tfp pilus assembly protein PilV